jgi:hypothetical protein
MASPPEDPWTRLSPFRRSRSGCCFWPAAATPTPRRRGLRGTTSMFATTAMALSVVASAPVSSRSGVAQRDPQPHANRRPGCLVPEVSERRICRVRKVFALTGAIRTSSGASTGDSAATAMTIPTSPLLLRRDLTRAPLGFDRALNGGQSEPDWPRRAPLAGPSRPLTGNAGGWLPLSGSHEGMPYSGPTQALARCARPASI